MNSPKDVKELTDALNLIKIGKHRCEAAVRRDFKVQKATITELTEKALEHIAKPEVQALYDRWMFSQQKALKHQIKVLNQQTQLPPMKDLVQEDYRLARYNPREKDWKDLAKEKYWKENEKQTMESVKKQMDGWIAEAQYIVKKEKTLHLRISTLQGKTLMGDIERSREGIADAKYITRAATDRLGNSKGMLNNRIRELQVEKHRYAVKRVKLLGRLQYESEKALLHNPRF